MYGNHGNRKLNIYTYHLLNIPYVKAEITSTYHFLGNMYHIIKGYCYNVIRAVKGMLIMIKNAMEFLLTALIAMLTAIPLNI